MGLRGCVWYSKIDADALSGMCINKMVAICVLDRWGGPVRMYAITGVIILD